MPLNAQFSAPMLSKHTRVCSCVLTVSYLHFTVTYRINILWDVPVSEKQGYISRNEKNVHFQVVIKDYQWTTFQGT